MSEVDEAGIRRSSPGRLRCGEWLVFAGIHDLMHLEQVHDLAATLERHA